MSTTKLKQREIKEYRDSVLKQDNQCPICNQGMVDPVLDHCHVTGHVRRVVCRECNALEGKLHNFMSRFMPTKDRETVLLGLIRYYQQDYSHNPIHPKHKTPAEKEIRTLKRRQKKAKRDSTKKKIQGMIDKLQES